LYDSYLIRINCELLPPHKQVKRSIFIETFCMKCLTACLAVIFLAFIPPPVEKWRPLFNGKDFSGWETYLGSKFGSDGKKLPEAAAGLNNDPQKVFTVVSLDGEKVIRISGEYFGAITSTEEYKNYHLQLKFKWGQKTWPPKIGKKKDSGLLYHAVGPHGAEGGFWMRSQEFQVEQGNCGDYWGVALGFESIPATMGPDSTYAFDAAAGAVDFGEHTTAGRHCRKKGDAENPEGQWNTLDLYCHGDSSIHVVNGKVMMVLLRSQQWDNGQAKPMTKGKIQIQSEGAEVYYKDIRIQGIHSLPNDLVPA
jgi:hypothetical protein